MNMGDNDAKSAKPFKQRKSFGEPFCCEKALKDLFTYGSFVVVAYESTFMNAALSVISVSRRDEVAGIRAKFPSKIPVRIVLCYFHYLSKHCLFLLQCT